MSWTPTNEETEDARLYAGLGLAVAEVAKLLGRDEDDVERELGDVMELGRLAAKRTVLEAAYRMAASGKIPGATDRWLAASKKTRRKTKPIFSLTADEMRRMLRSGDVIPD